MTATLVGGCGLPTKHSAPVFPALPTQWSQGATAGIKPGDTPVQAWWLALDDDALTALITQALQSNRDVARGALRWRQAALQARVAGLDSWPRPAVGFSAGVQRPLGAGAGATSILVDGVSIPVSNARTATRSSGVSGSASYEFDLWTRVALAQTLALDVVAAGRADLEAARWLITTKVAEQYWTLGTLAPKLELASAAIRDAQASLAATLLRFEAGKLRPADVDRSRLALEVAHTQELALATQRVSAVHALALLVDVPPEQFDAPPARLPEVDPPQVSVGSPAQVLDRRPDLQSARLALDGALHKLNIAEANRYPQLTLSATLASGGSGILHQILSNPVGSLGLGLAIPLVDWKRTQTNRDLAGLQLDEAAITFREALYKALVEVESAFAQRRQLVAELTDARRKLRAAEDAVAVAKLRYESGAEALQAVRDAEQARRDANVALLDLRLKSWFNQVATDKALGGPVDDSQGRESAR